MGIRNWVKKKLHDSVIDYSEKQNQATPDMSHIDADQLVVGLPLAMLVYPIENGYLMRVQEPYRPEIGTQQKVKVFYAADEKGIAEQIIAKQAREILNPQPAQGEMFEASQMAQTKAAPTLARGSK